MDNCDLKMTNDFLQHSRELLEISEQKIRDLIEGFDSKDIIDEIFRDIHNLKSSAAAVGLFELSSFGHKVEGILKALQESKLKPTAEVGSLLLQCNDIFFKYIEGYLSDLYFTLNTDDTILKIDKILVNNT